jgi:hypothetical protein
VGAGGEVAPRPRLLPNGVPTESPCSWWASLESHLYVGISSFLSFNLTVFWGAKR